MIPRLRPDVGLRELSAAAFGSTSVEAFEQRFAALMGQRHAIAFPYGRTALHLLLGSMGISGKEIVCPAYTCVVVAHAIVLSGNIPVFVDSEDGGFNMELDKAAAAVTDRTGAILATSIHGYPVDLDRLERLRERFPGVAVIQDCAHSFAAEWHGRPVQRAGDAAIFGLNVSKIMTSIFGGMVTTDDDALAARLRADRAGRIVAPGAGRRLSRAAYLLAASAALHPAMFGVVTGIMKLGLIDRFTTYYDESLIDMPADHLVGLGRAEASVGAIQCGKYEAIVEHRRTIAAVYDRALAGFAPAVGRPPLVEGATYSHYVIQVADPLRLKAKAAAKGIELGRVIDYCIPDMEAYRAMVPPGATFPRTRELNRTILNLPLHVDAATAERIAAIIGSLA